MIKKTLLIAALVLSASSLWAQEGRGGYPYKCGMGADFGYGTALNVGVRGQYYINKNLTWDFLQYRAIGDFNNTLDSHDYFNALSLTSGLRAYTPEFGRHFKAFAAAGMGWGFSYTNDKGESTWYNKTHNFATDLSAGLFVWGGLYVGYNCQIIHNGSCGTRVDHAATVGFEFGSVKKFR